MIIAATTTAAKAARIALLRLLLCLSSISDPHFVLRLSQQSSVIAAVNIPGLS